MEIARQIPRGTIYDRNGIPLATSNWEELQQNRDQYLKLGIYLDQVTDRSQRRYYPFAGRTFHLLGDWRTRANWAASNTSFEERDSNVRLQGYDDRARIVELKDRRRQACSHPQVRLQRIDSAASPSLSAGTRIGQAGSKPRA